MKDMIWYCETMCVYAFEIPRNQDLSYYLILSLHQDLHIHTKLLLNITFASGLTYKHT